LVQEAWIASAWAGADPPLGNVPVLKLIENVEPVYPPAALRDRIEARVVLQLDIDPTGHVTDTLVVSSSTVAENPEAAKTSTVTVLDFVLAAKKAAKQLVFEPIEYKGKKVSVRVAYTINFQLPPLPKPEVATSSTSTAGASKDYAASGPGVENFTGAVRERGTRRLISGAVVTIYRGDAQDEGFEAISDRNGRFHFTDLEAGEWKVIVELEGYFPFRTTETIRANEAIDVTYYVERGNYNRFDVLVEAQREKKEVTRRQLTMAEIVRIPGTFNDPILAVENLPGVARPAFGSGEVIVRGSAPADTALYIDGIDVPLIFHFGGLRSVVPPEVLDTLNFYPGNFGVQYGGATGGVLDVATKHLHPDQIHGSVDINLLDAGLYLETPIGKDLSIAIAGRRSYADVILKAVIPSDASVSFNTLPRWYDGQVLVRWKPSDEHELRLLYFGSNDAVEVLFKNPADVDIQLQSGSLAGATLFDRLALEYTFNPSSHFRNLARFTIGRDVVSFHLGGQLRFDLSSKTAQARDTATYTIDQSLAFSAGIDTAYYVSDVSILAPRPPKEGDAAFDTNLNDVVATNVNQAVQLGFAPFLEAKWSPIDRLHLIPGVRFDYFKPVDQWSIDPRLVARYEVNEAWTAKAGIGLYHQQPTPDETDKNFGNPDLGLEQAIHYSVGTEWRPTTWFNIDATLYYKDLSHLVSRTDANITRDGMTVPAVYDNNGVGRAYGLELLVRKTLTDNFYGTIAYTLSRSERKDSGATDYRIFQFDQTHIFNLIAGYQFLENWELNVRWRIISGNPTTPYVRGVFNSDFDRYSPIPGPVYSARLPTFQQLDIGLYKSWIYDWWTLTAYINLVNAYNYSNTEAIAYNYNYTQSASRTGFPIFPILGVKGEL
jgi:TonB family protein